MPWKKVLSTKNFMHCHSNVLNWDDSAGKEAFLDAKKRFWEEINGLPCETQLPTRDMYIDEIDWSPYIDPELVAELDREYFNPDDKYYLPSSKGNNRWPDHVSNPWEPSAQSTAVQDKATGWNTWDNNWPNDDDDHPESGCVQNTSEKDKTPGWNQWDKSGHDDDPWESRCKQGDEVRGQNSNWGGACHESWGSKPQNSNSWRNEGNRWQVRGASSRGWNQNRGSFSKPDYLNGNYKPWEFDSRHGTRVPNGRGNSWGQKQWDNSNWRSNDCSNISRGRGRFDSGCRKREGPDQYAANHKGPRLQGGDYQSPRLQGGDYQSSRYWNGANSKRVTSGDQWS